jgi:hypothetical protein
VADWNNVFFKYSDKHFMDNKKKQKWFWPEIYDLDSAVEATKASMYISIILGFITLAAILFGTVPALGLVDALLYFLCAIGVYFHSRTAAVMALSILSLNVINNVVTKGIGGGFIMVFFCLVGLIAGIRGTFAYHRLKRQLPDGSPENHSKEKKTDVA